jgi:hypothetical protein
MQTKPLNQKNNSHEYNIHNKDVALRTTAKAWKQNNYVSAWVSISNVSIHLIQHGDEIRVVAYPKGHELTPELASFSLDTQDVKVAIQALQEKKDLIEAQKS